MAGKISPGYDKNRQILNEIIPLSMPMTLFIAPSQLCNFKCHYCAHSKAASELKQLGFKRLHQPMDLFKKIIRDSKEFGNKYKRVLLTGLGEPTLNRDIGTYVMEIRDAQISEKIEIFTNGSRLTPELSKKLIDGGLTKLRVSLQGTSDSAYLKNAGVKVNVKDIQEKLSFFYEMSRGRCQVYLKIIDEELDGDNDRQRFFEMFSPYADEIFVENLVRAQPIMGDYDDKIGTDRTFYGESAEKRLVCPYIFYTLQIDSEGNCFPCPPLGHPIDFSIGNINDLSLFDIWNGPKHRALMLSHLRMDGSRPDNCQRCTCYLAFTPPEDALDQHAERLLATIGD